MAGFLRKKPKHDSPTKPLPPVTSSPSASSSPPPLFARFATTAQNANAPASQRIVSSPMALAGRKELMKTGSGIASNNSLVSGNRDAEAVRRRAQEQFQALQPSVNGPYYYSNSIQPQAAPFRTVSVDKPLPSPIAAGSAPLPVMNRRPTANRTQVPQPPGQQHTLNNARSRASLDARAMDQKPLPHPGSVQAYYWQEPKSPPPSTYRFTPNPPPKRNASFSTPTTPQIAKMQAFPPTAYSHQGPFTTDAGNFAGQSIPPPISKGPISRQDFRPDNTNDTRNGLPHHRPQMQLQDTRGTPMSNRAVDLPPEFALFQEYSETLPVPSNRQSIYQDSPPNSLKATEQVPGAQQQPFSIYREPNKELSKPQPSIPQFENDIPQRVDSPPLPPPPEDMGLSTSHAAVAEILPSSYKDFYTQHGLPYTNLPTSTYSRPSDVIQHQPPQAPPNRSQNSSTSPPLPAGASLHVNYPPLSQRRSPDAPPPPEKNLDLPFQYRPSPSPLQNNLVPQMGQMPSQPTQPPPQLRKSPSMGAATNPLKGKPRIFAAMEGNDNEFEQASNTKSFYTPLPPQRPQQQPLHQLYSPQPQLEPPQVQMNSHVAYQAELLPSVDLFSTPKSQLDPLPSEFGNENTLHSDPRASPAHTTPPSPQKSFVLDSLPMTVQVAERSPPRPKNGRSRSGSGDTDILQQQQQQPQQQPPPAVPQPGTPARLRKLSKSRSHVDHASIYTHPNGSVSTLPSTPESHTSKIHQHGGHKYISKPQPPTPVSPQKQPSSYVNEAATFDTGIPLDDDPFARVEGVTMLKPMTPPPPREGSIKRHRAKESSRAMSSESVVEDMPAKSETGHSEDAVQVAGPQKTDPVPLAPASPEDYRQWRKEHKSSKSVVAPPVPVVERIHRQETHYDVPLTLTQFVANPQLLSSLLAYLTFYDWCILSSVSREIRILFVRTPLLREAILESYLKTVGYARWLWDGPDPLSLSLQDLSDYMRGVSTPTHEYSRVAAMHVHSLTIHPNHRDPALAETVRALTNSTRAYSRVVLRLRAQAEKEASVHAAAQSQPQPPPSSTPSLYKGNGNFSPSRPGTGSRVSSRAPSPTSMYSYTQHGNSQPPTSLYQSPSQTSLTFRSPLFRLRRAPLLRVFVPSPEGDWLSDKSVLECEAECKRSGIGGLMRLGDVVWDVAVGDEGNVGRLVWDGSYLIDLDYTYSTIGDLPKYLPTLAFPPSYFHRVIRTGAHTANPIVHVDISPWGEEIALNLQLLQDRVRTETPQGAYHNVVRWVHRSSFTIRPSRGSAPRYGSSARASPGNGRIPIPESNNLFVDSGWYGTIVVETEGTNEALADLQDRCGPGAFPPRPKNLSARATQAQVENRKVFRILRERSRPGEIWIKAVSVKERLL